jgi:hypothetical protein
MRHIRIVLPIFFIVTFLSCKKDNENDLQKLNTVVGEWTWINSCGGFTGTDMQTPTSSNSTKRIIFKDNSEFIMLENGDTIHKTTYFTSREKSILFQDTFNFVTVNYKYRIMGTDSIVTLPMRYIIRNMSDSLKIDEDVYDGYCHRYLRNKK